MSKLHDTDDPRSFVLHCELCERYAIHHYRGHSLCWKHYEKATEKKPELPDKRRLIELDEETRWGL